MKMIVKTKSFKIIDKFPGNFVIKDKSNNTYIFSYHDRKKWNLYKVINNPGDSTLLLTKKTKIKALRNTSCEELYKLAQKENMYEQTN